MKRIKANNSTSSFILLFIFLLASILFMLVFLHFLSMKKNMEENDNTNTVSTSKITTETITTTTKEQQPIEFDASLARILSDTELVGKYNTEVGYEDAKFIFKCATYNEADKTCEAGSASMIVEDDITINLYTFASANYDYSLRPNDYYIIVNDSYIIIAMNKAGIEPGVMKVYNKKGKNLRDIKNYISGYLSNDRIINMQYPAYDKDKIALYQCDKNAVHQIVVDFTNDFNIISDDIMADVSCY